MRDTKITMQLDWFQALADEFKSVEMDRVSGGIDAAIVKYGDKSVYPKKELIFKAFEITPLANVKAVFVGLEPTEETASGLFLESTHAPVGPMSDQLRRVFSLYNDDYPNNFNTLLMSGETVHWAEQGILLLNLSLTSRAGQPKRHLGHWAFFVARVLETLLLKETPVAFVPFGKTPTAAIEQLILPQHHRVIAFEKGFFLEINKWFESVGHEPIEW